MKQEEKISYLKALLFIALADDNVDESELDYFNRFGEMYGLSSQELDDIKNAVITRKEPIESIVKGITERTTKLTLIYELIALCYADGTYSVAEQAGLMDVCRALEIELEKLTEIEEVMKENVCLQEKINVVLERGKC